MFTIRKKNKNIFFILFSCSFIINTNICKFETGMSEAAANKKIKLIKQKFLYEFEELSKQKNIGFVEDMRGKSYAETIETELKKVAPNKLKKSLNPIIKNRIEKKIDRIKKRIKTALNAISIAYKEKKKQKGRTKAPEPFIRTKIKKHLTFITDIEKNLSELEKITESAKNEIGKVFEGKFSIEYINTLLKKIQNKEVKKEFQQKLDDLESILNKNHSILKRQKQKELKEEEEGVILFQRPITLFEKGVPTKKNIDKLLEFEKNIKNVSEQISIFINKKPSFKETITEMNKKRSEASKISVELFKFQKETNDIRKLDQDLQNKYDEVLGKIPTLMNKITQYKNEYKNKSEFHEEWLNKIKKLPATFEHLVISLEEKENKKELKKDDNELDSIKTIYNQLNKFLEKEKDLYRYINFEKKGNKAQLDETMRHIKNRMPEYKNYIEKFETLTTKQQLLTKIEFSIKEAKIELDNFEKKKISELEKSTIKTLQILYKAKELKDTIQSILLKASFEEKINKVKKIFKKAKNRLEELKLIGEIEKYDKKQLDSIEDKKNKIDKKLTETLTLIYTQPFKTTFKTLHEAKILKHKIIPNIIDAINSNENKNAATDLITVISTYIENFENNEDYKNRELFYIYKKEQIELEKKIETINQSWQYYEKLSNDVANLATKVTKLSIKLGVGKSIQLRTNLLFSLTDLKEKADKLIKKAKLEKEK